MGYDPGPGYLTSQPPAASEQRRCQACCTAPNLPASTLADHISDRQAGKALRHVKGQERSKAVTNTHVGNSLAVAAPGNRGTRLHMAHLATAAAHQAVAAAQSRPRHMAHLAVVACTLLNPRTRPYLHMARQGAGLHGLPAVPAPWAECAAASGAVGAQPSLHAVLSTVGWH